MRVRDLLRLPKLVKGVEDVALEARGLVDRYRPRKEKKNPYNGMR